MLALPMDRSFETFKAALGSAMQDYGRLIKVASIGVAAGLAWHQRHFQVTCMDLVRNGRWWHQLNLLGKPNLCLFRNKQYFQKISLDFH